MARGEASSPSMGNHLIAGLVAVLVSLVLHVVLAFVLSRIDVVPGKRSDQVRRAHKIYEAFKLREQPELTSEVEEKVLEELRRSGAAGPVWQLDSEVSELVPDADEAVTEPPPAEQEELAAQESSVLEPGALPSRDEWTPRQEILAIEELAVPDEVPGFERQVIPVVERVKNAAPVQGGGSELTGEMVVALTAPVAHSDPAVPAPIVVPDFLPSIPGEGSDPSPMPEPVLDEVGPGEQAELFEEAPDEITDTVPIESLLTYRLETYRGLRDFRHGYFRLEVERISEDALPHMPKDVIFVQDCSASLAEQRLYFCRRGLKQSLPFIGKDDRFNIASFKESLSTCFLDWVAPTDANITRAEVFIDGMRSGGNTDIYRSLKALLELKREPGRPLIAVVITDGLANTGYTSSSRIISQFSRENEGRISVFTLGTFKLANSYLVDLLSYCNRGDVALVNSGRWDIPDAIEGVVSSTARPVLNGLRLRLPAGTECELYPGQPTNLYLDRPLVLYGRYPRGAEGLVVQALGDAGDSMCDSIFELAFTDEVRGDDEGIKQAWAQQKIYHLMGEYARTGNPDALKDLNSTSRAYQENIPYRQVLAP